MLPPVRLSAEFAATGELRDDAALDGLPSRCPRALTVAGGPTSEAAVRRLVTVTLAGLRPAR